MYKIAITVIMNAYIIYIYIHIQYMYIVYIHDSLVHDITLHTVPLTAGNVREARALHLPKLQEIGS
jgi:hypothetical protein